LRNTLMQQARECVRRKFDIHRMVDNLEEYLLGMVHHTQLGLGSNLSPWPGAENRGDHATAVSE
jgi:hypothetical protein